MPIIDRVPKCEWDPKPLEALIKAAGLSNKQAAANIGIGHATLRLWLHDRAFPNMERMVQVADYFGVPMDYLLGRCDEKTSCEILENYPKVFNQICRGAYESYLKTHLKSEDVVPEGYYAPYPYNLIEVIFGEAPDLVLTKEQEDGFELALTRLSKRESDYIIKVYRDGKTLSEIGREANVTRERVRQIVSSGVRTLRHPSNKNLIMYGPELCNLKTKIEQERLRLRMALEENLKLERELKAKKANVELLKKEYDAKTFLKDSDMDLDLRVTEMYLSARATHVLTNNGINTLGELIDFLNVSNPKKFRNCGVKTYHEIVEKVKEYTNLDYSDRMGA